MTSSRPALVAAPDISLHLGRSRRDRPAPSLALLLDPPQPVGFVFVGIVSGRRRYQLRALLAEMIETTAQLEPASVCWSLAQSPQPLSPPLCPARYPPRGLAACLSRAALRILSRMGTKSRETIYGSSVRAAAERATEARKEADRLAVEAWNKRMLGFRGPAQPSPALGDALNAGYRYLEVKCLGCNTHQTVALDLCDDRRQRRSMSWSATCAARIVPRSEAIPTSGAIWWRCARPRSRRAIRPRRGGRGNDR
jgi:hypothetical protein